MTIDVLRHLPQVHAPACPDCLGRPQFISGCSTCAGAGRLFGNQCAGTGLGCDREARAGSSYCATCYAEVMSDWEDA
jgi:hypothetical protein